MHCETKIGCRKAVSSAIVQVNNVDVQVTRAANFELGCASLLVLLNNHTFFNGVSVKIKFFDDNTSKLEKLSAIEVSVRERVMSCVEGRKVTLCVLALRKCE
jgi:hypothetical protein